MEQGRKGKLTVSWAEKKGGAKHYRFYYSKLDEIEENLVNQGYKTTIKDVEELDFVSPSLQFKEDVKDQELTDITNLEGIQKQWNDLIKTLEGKKTLEEEVASIEEKKRPKKKTETKGKGKDKDKDKGKGKDKDKDKGKGKDKDKGKGKKK